ncbi:hypothetical protein GOV09_01385 [Candidatus Woesearchaeota archaeon]|nr:hypothetical protein [Candidatus Woesearchaeota archaeon]
MRAPAQQKIDSPEREESHPAIDPEHVIYPQEKKQKKKLKPRFSLFAFYLSGNMPSFNYDVQHGRLTVTETPRFKDPEFFEPNVNLAYSTGSEIMFNYWLSLRPTHDGYDYQNMGCQFSVSEFPDFRTRFTHDDGGFKVFTGIKPFGPGIEPFHQYDFDRDQHRFGARLNGSKALKAAKTAWNYVRDIFSSK